MPCKRSSAALRRMRCVISSATDDHLLVCRERTAVNLDNGQRPEHLRERERWCLGVGSYPRWAPSLVSAHKRAGVDGADLDLVSSETQLDCVAGFRPGGEGAAPLEAEQPVACDLAGGALRH